MLRVLAAAVKEVYLYEIFVSKLVILTEIDLLLFNIASCFFYFYTHSPAFA